MDCNLKEKTVKSFYAYVYKFRIKGDLCKPLKEKLEHIERVAANCLYIASSENWSETDRFIAELCGYYHDIGRFPQYAKYGTFSDSSSINHGQQGFNTIISEKLLAGLDSEDSKIIMDSVCYHNSFEIPAFLCAKSMDFTKLVRDADKIDIFFMLTEAIKKGELDKHRDLLWNLPMGFPNAAIVKKLMGNQQGLYSEIKSATDVCLLQLTWLYGMNYKASFVKISDSLTVDFISNIMPDTDEVRDCIKHIKNFINLKISQI